MPTFSSPPSLTRSKNDLLCVGEMLVDLLAADFGELAEIREYRRFAGGSPANLAVNARRLGLSAEVLASVGADGWGDFLVGSLEESGLGSSLIQRREEAPTSLVVLSRARGTPSPIFYRGADSLLEASPESEAVMRESSILHLSCWPLSAEPSSAVVSGLIGAAREAGAMVCLDPNYHPAIWPDRGEAIAAIGRIMAWVDIVKPSKDDADRLFGVDEPPRHLRRFLDLGAGTVIMTLGAEGAIASDGGDLREYPSIADAVADTTGAGDAFWAGLYAGLLGGRDLDRSIRVGMAASALKLRVVGMGVPPSSLASLEAEFGLGVPERG